MKIADVAELQKVLVPDTDVVQSKSADSEEVVLAALHKFLQRTPRYPNSGITVAWLYIEIVHKCTRVLACKDTHIL